MRYPFITGSTTLFSLIVPTRGRPAALRRMLDSLRDTARNPASVEVIAVMDEDDRESRELACTEHPFKRVLVPPGQTMGNLNLAGYRAARGRYLMLLNDDVEARTPGWDTQLLQVLEEHTDGIVLAHVNELIFGDILCTFPVLTREFCELAGGICRPEYRRYRIDDHIHHVFDLICLLGHARRVFLPDVVFEHHNFVRSSSGGLEYVPDPAIHELDSRDFQALIEERRRLALACVERIEGSASIQERAARSHLLQAFPDSGAVRRREHARWWRAPGSNPSAHRPGVPKLSATRPAWRTRAAYWGVETFAKLAARWPVCAKLGVGIPAALFDASWYLARYPDVAASGQNPLLHYLERGGFQGYNPNPHFDSSWYLNTNPDVAASGLNPLLHFVRCGARERRNPSLLFDVCHYELQNPGIAATGMNPLEHFVASGLQDGRAPRAGLTVAEYLYLIRLDPRSRPST